MLTLEAHIDGAWREAGLLRLPDLARGINGASRFSYDDTYFFDHAAIDGLDRDVIDRRALSVRTPVNLESRSWDSWPPWLLDLMPQGVARQRIAATLGLSPDVPASELPILRRAAGSPIGNLRIREAWVEEQQRLADVTCPPLSDRDIAERSERFLEVVDRFAHLASGSSGVQGEWPKALMTRSLRDGCWYPDPFVPTGEGAEHAIVKLLRSSGAEDVLIIASEAPYLEVARTFGLAVAAPLRYGNGVLFMPRFDRSVRDGMVLLHGQESLVSALGVAAFGHLAWHEDYLSVIRAVSDDPVADTLEYVLRDLLNAAMGNPDNHGRNSALHKPATGGVRLSPLYDFAPMRLSAAGVGRSTRWRCLDGRGIDPDWGRIADAVAFDGLPADRVRQVLLSKLPLLRDLTRLGRDLDVPPLVVARAFQGDVVADALERSC